MIPARAVVVLGLVAALPSRPFTVAGRLLDGDRPVAGARVGLIDSRSTAVSDSAGNFALGAKTVPPTGVAPPAPSWSFREGFLAVKSASPILQVRVASTDGRILSNSKPGTPTARIRVPGTTRRPVILEVRTAAGAWSTRVGLAASSTGFHALARSASGQDTLCIVASDRPIVRVAVVDSSLGLRIQVPPGRWISGDFHNHTVLTDGSHTMAEVFAHALGGRWDVLDAGGRVVADSSTAGFGLDWIANSEHGGVFCRDPRGLPWDSATVRAKGAPPAGCLWRWQSLLESSWPLLDSLRGAHPGKTIVQGLEWNVPGHDHASVGILAASARPIATFEYLFDRADTDTAADGGLAVLAPDVPKDLLGTHARALAAIRWLEDRHRDSGYVLFNHPSRVLATSAADLRDALDAGPHVFLGIEAMPGHPKFAWRGGYSLSVATSDSVEARTAGGADRFLARLGGVADALWSEGRPLRIFANSDFHAWNESMDAWPGEYARNVNLARDASASGVLAALREGAGYCQTGSLVSALDFRIDDGVSSARSGSSFARHDPTDSVSLVVRWRPAGRNARGDVPVLDHLDLIAGPLDAGSSDRTRSSVEGVQVVRRLAPSDFAVLPDGWREAVVRMRPDRPAFYRLRGTNLPPSTPGETDAHGDPLVDSEAGPNSAAQAWNDLWLYTNPIFLVR